MSLPWVPRFDYTDGSLVLTYPITRIIPGARTEGRVMVTATGVVGASLSLRKYTLGMTLRFTEDEWDAVMEFIAVVQNGNAFLWYPNANDDVTPNTIDVFFESPHVTDRIQPKRDDALIWLMTLPIVVSRMDSPWNVEYFRVPVGE